jgi:hypothetical protein
MCPFLLFLHISHAISKRLFVIGGYGEPEDDGYREFQVC